jgi:hypothetical protein
MKNVLVWLSFFAIVGINFFAPRAEAKGWSWGVGYHNPPGATIGVNFMHLWSNWAFETGIGYIGVGESWNRDGEREATSFTVAGDVNMKYLFDGRTFRPYLQGGFGAALSTATNGSVGAGTSLSHPFAGAGLFIFGRKFYFYASYLFVNENALQLGIGF